MNTFSIHSLAEPRSFVWPFCCGGKRCMEGAFSIRYVRDAHILIWRRMIPIFQTRQFVWSCECEDHRATIWMVRVKGGRYRRHLFPRENRNAHIRFQRRDVLLFYHFSKYPMIHRPKISRNVTSSVNLSTSWAFSKSISKNGNTRSRNFESDRPNAGCAITASFELHVWDLPRPTFYTCTYCRRCPDFHLI